MFLWQGQNYILLHKDTGVEKTSYRYFQFSYFSTTMQPDQGSARDGQHGQPDVSLAWEEGQAEALPRQRPMYCSSQKRGIFFPVTFLKGPG